MRWSRIFLFASGDFACNLYWQSITFYLLFFYTETLGLSPAVAGLITLVASIWDGISGLLIGIAADRGDARRFIRLGALPLGVAFAALYLPVSFGGAWVAAFALVSHMVFRTLYVAVNVPYAALTVRIAPDSVSRSRIAGLRMILGGIAAVVVALGTQRGIDALTEAGRPGFGYFSAAIAFAITGTVILVAVARMRASTPPSALLQSTFTFAGALRTIAFNRPFVMVNLGICGGVAAMAVLMRAIPFYFKYEMGDPAAAAATLGMMSAAGVAAIPIWMALASRFGHRVQWQASAAGAALALIGLLLMPRAPLHVVQMLFVLFYGAAQGLFFGFWALLPDVVEHGGPAGAARIDTLLFGVAALLQKLAQGVAVALFGGLLSASGYIAGHSQQIHVLQSLHLMTGALPLMAIAVASGAMLRFPRDLNSQPSS